MNEISLFFNISPDSTIAQEVIESNKKDKVQITVAFICNADSTDHFESMFIRHANKSQSFNRKTGKELGFFYHYNKKVWITGIFFQNYLKKFDQYVHHLIILVIDNALSHIWTNLQLCYIKVISLLPNITSKLQPFNAEIIAAFKRHYCWS